MDGIHDVGGMHGFGHVDFEPDAPAFHHDWERRAFASFVATLGQGLYNMDEVRHSIERMEPAHYLAAPYYEKWLTGMERLLVEKEVLTPESVVSCLAAFERGEAPVPDRENPALVNELRRGMADAYEAGTDPRASRFDSGDTVVVRNVHPSGHTRVPRYVRGNRGTVHAVQGTFSIPDADAHGEAEAAPVYNVGFDPADLWGPDGEGTELRMDLWEPSLESPAECAEHAAVDSNGDSIR